MNFDIGYIFELVPKLIKYIPITLWMAVIAMVLAVVLGLVLALARNSDIKVLKYIANAYISFFRAIPMLVQLFLIYYGLPQIFPVFSGMGAVMAAILGFGFKQAAYLAEIFRAAFASVDKGQMEACITGGMTKVQAYRRIILPQAARNALPATGNIFIGLIKETSLAFTLGVTEIFAEAKMQATDTLRFFEAYLAVALIYWIIISIYSFFQRMLEKYLEKPYRV